MKRVDQKKKNSTPQKAKERDPRVVPLMVPHGCAGAGRDFESAFDVLPGDRRVHELWHRGPGKNKPVRAS